MGFETTNATSKRWIFGNTIRNEAKISALKIHDISKSKYIIELIHQNLFGMGDQSKLNHHISSSCILLFHPNVLFISSLNIKYNIHYEIREMGKTIWTLCSIVPSCCCFCVLHSLRVKFCRLYINLLHAGLVQCIIFRDG